MSAGFHIAKAIGLKTERLRSFTVTFSADTPYGEVQASYYFLPDLAGDELVVACKRFRLTEISDGAAQAGSSKDIDYIRAQGH